ncbi:MAG: NAD(P)H-hydrate epimerase [Halopseudomonas sp.]|jgi:NAD(P)H-hydrate epimerase
MLGQGLQAGTAARYAVLIHGMAGDAAAVLGERGLLATDLMMPIRRLLNIQDLK